MVLEAGAPTRDRIVDAAIGLLCTHSYPALGVKSICDAAGVLKGSFYHFFDSKEELVLAAVDTAWSEFKLSIPDGDGADQACIFSRLAASVTNSEPFLRARLGEIFGEWAALLGNGEAGWSELEHVQGRLVISFATEAPKVAAP